ncbi:hypothetical protein LOTGIDRAFT_157853 [Lottia gigantea]|uniref:Tetraspanin n=1 Tax=Lottia gigantea TaxID=225164 RepID=V4B2G9_LOTGI|nr:hypothetical protein LOTGIDRAFT_157853 [Lottia gigantea]ESP00577.1 hypothetical protein LOTGIDRAFT_157853 [Lottia gigantea]
MPAPSCGKCLKYLLLVFNILTLLIGCAVLVVGLYTLLSQFGSREVAAIVGTDLYEAGSYVLIAGGGLIIVISFCGWCGTIQENRTFLCCYIFILSLLLTVFIAAAVVGFIFKDQITDQLQVELETRIIYKYGVNLDIRENNFFTEAWDRLQLKIMCCGVSGNINSTDSWAFYKHYHTRWYEQFQPGSPYVPESCCDPAGEDPKCQGDMEMNGPPSLGPPVNSDMVLNMALYTDGCFDKIKNILKFNSVLIAIIGVTALAFTLLAILLSICLFRYIGDGEVV